MEIVLNLDEPKTKFLIGDVININNNGIDIFGLISRIIYTGSFTSCKQCGKSFGNISDVRYEYVIQHGSRCHQTSTLLRPGLRYLEFAEKLEKYDKIDFPHKLIDGDTKDNFQQRQKEWRGLVNKNG